MIYDVAVIGAGVVGALIARELSRYELNICIIESETDVGLGSSSANSGIVHAGYDAEPGSLKALLNVRGNILMDNIAAELEVPFKRNGSIVLAFNEDEMESVRDLYEKGLVNGVTGLRILLGDEVRDMEPNVSENAVGALYASTGGIICPYELTISAVENAVDNGVDLKLEHRVLGIRKQGSFMIVETAAGEICSRYVVNAAGLFSDEISAMAGENGFRIKPRKGEYLLLDKRQGRTVNTVVFQVPSKLGKGILVSPSTDGNLLIGPNAVDIEDKTDDTTSSAGLEQVIHGALKSVPSINVRDVITSFAGIRATPDTGDFIIGASKKVKGFINAAGIESPGLTSSPAIAGLVADILRKEGLHLERRKDFNPIRHHIKRFDSMGSDELNSAIKRIPAYGHIVCRCERVSEAEIIDAIDRPAGARSLDGVKRRTRAGMGRCQGGFCTPRVAEILSSQLGIAMEQVTKTGGESWILKRRTK